MEAKKIIDYKVVTGYISSDSNKVFFENKVLDLIKLGYIPIGGVANYKGDCFQALIKYED